jgi:hypothetical protein
MFSSDIRGFDAMVCTDRVVNNPAKDPSTQSPVIHNS